MMGRCASCGRFRFRLDEAGFCRACQVRLGLPDGPLWSNPLQCRGCDEIGPLLLSTVGRPTATCPRCGEVAAL